MNSADYPELQSLLERWFVELDAGREPSVESICRGRPDLRPHFERIVGRDRQILAALAPDEGTGRAGEESAERDSVVFPRVDGYEILHHLGSGGRGDVFLARQESLSRLVALKVLHAGPGQSSTATAKARARLLREAELTALLDHPSIVPVYDVGESSQLDDGSPPVAYISMKWLSGPDMGRLDARLPVDEVVRIGIVVARGLHEAHLAGVVHRDVKPANIVLDRGEPRIVDFGIARTSDRVTNTIEGQVAGTLPYMSPEQLRSGTERHALDGRTDVYSLGVTLYELIAGHRPFEAEEPAVLIQSILQKDPARIPGLNRDLMTILERALAKVRDRRFESAKAFADDLERYQRGEPILSRRAGPLGRLVRKARRNPRVATAFATGALVVVLLGGALAVESIESDREYRGRLTRIQDLLDAEEFRLAGQLLAQLESEGRVPARLLERFGAEMALEEALDQLQLRRGSLDTARLRSVMGSENDVGVRRSLLAEGRERIWRLSLVVCHILADESERAIEVLESLPPSRARAALTAVLRGDAWPWDLPTAEPGGVWDHLFTVIAMREAELEPELVREELALAEAIDRRDYRVRLQALAWRADLPGQEREAFVGFQSLMRNGEHARAVVRMTLYLAWSLRETDEMRGWLAYFLAQFPRSEWTGIDAAIVVVCYEHLGETARGASVLEDALARWPQCAPLWLSEARRLTLEGDLDGAVEAAAKAVSVAGRRRVRDVASAGLCELRFSQVSTDPASTEADLVGFEGEARGLVDRIHDDESKSRILTCLARLGLETGDLEGAARDLDAVFELGADVDLEAYFWAGQVAIYRAAQLRSGGPRTESELLHVAREGGERLRYFLDPAHWSGRFTPTEDERVSALAALAGLYGHLGEDALRRAAADDALELGGDNLDPRMRDFLNRLR